MGCREQEELGLGASRTKEPGGAGQAGGAWTDRRTASGLLELFR